MYCVYVYSGYIFYDCKVLDRKEYQFLAEQRTFISIQFVTYIFFNRFY